MVGDARGLAAEGAAKPTRCRGLVEGIHFRVARELGGELAFVPGGKRGKARAGAPAGSPTVSIALLVSTHKIASEEADKNAGDMIPSWNYTGNWVSSKHVACERAYRQVLASFAVCFACRVPSSR